jgi:predicted RNA-binding protein Jag
MTKQIKDLCTRFFEMAKIQIDSLDVTCEDEIKNIFYINLQTPDSKLIIGTHGQTLDSLKHLL